MFETIGVPVNFPLASQGIIFAVIELAGALTNLGYGLSIIKIVRTLVLIEYFYVLTS